MVTRAILRPAAPADNPEAFDDAPRVRAIDLALMGLTGREIRTVLGRRRAVPAEEAADRWAAWVDGRKTR